eukprot:scaffold7778_cov105-Cylindrotheca_fusiformis.AAC.1
MHCLAKQVFRTNKLQISRCGSQVVEAAPEKWGVDNVDSCQDSRTRIAPHDTNGHAGGDAVTVAHFSCGPTTADGTRDCFSPEPISHHNKPRSTTSRKEQDDRQRAAPVDYLR